MTAARPLWLRPAAIALALVVHAAAALLIVARAPPAPISPPDI